MRRRDLTASIAIAAALIAHGAVVYFAVESEIRGYGNYFHAGRPARVAAREVPLPEPERRPPPEPREKPEPPEPVPPPDFLMGRDDGAGEAVNEDVSPGDQTAPTIDEMSQAWQSQDKAGAADAQPADRLTPPGEDGNNGTASDAAPVFAAPVEPLRAPGETTLTNRKPFKRVDRADEQPTENEAAAAARDLFPAAPAPGAAHQPTDHADDTTSSASGAGESPADALAEIERHESASTAEIDPALPSGELAPARPAPPPTPERPPGDTPTDPPAAKAGGPGTPEEIAGRPVVESDRTADAVAKNYSAQFTRGRVAVQAGSEVRFANPRKHLAAIVDTVSVAPRAQVHLAITVDAAGQVRNVVVVKSCGAASLDRAFQLAAYESYFQPGKDAQGQPVGRSLVFVITVL